MIMRQEITTSENKGITGAETTEGRIVVILNTEIIPGLIARIMKITATVDITTVGQLDVAIPHKGVDTTPQVEILKIKKTKIWDRIF